LYLIMYLRIMPWSHMEDWRYSSIIHIFGTRWGEWSASGPYRFTTRDRAPGAHRIGGWVSLRAGLQLLKTLIGTWGSESNFRADRYKILLIRTETFHAENNRWWTWTATSYRVRFPLGAGIHFFAKRCKIGFRTTESPMQWVSWDSFLKINRLECEADHSLSFNAEI
jgi:hypothetical protein